MTGAADANGFLAQLDAAASTSGDLVFLHGRDATTVTMAELWRASERAASWLQQEGLRVVGTVLDTSPACLALVLGALRSGRTLVSLPLPARGVSPTSYLQMTERMIALAGVEAVVVSAELVELAGDLPVRSHPFDACAATGTARDDGVEGCLVQFTSGSTAEPKGVVLPVAKVGANVDALLEVLTPDRHDVACSWLPLSHDMGLIGMVFTSLCGFAPRYANGGRAVFLTPQAFLRSPELWMDACARYAATITAGPDFGYALAVRRAPATVAGRLDSLRACIIGAEPVRPATLLSFTSAFADRGFNGRAFCPAYGMAELGLAASMVRPDDRWSTLPAGIAAEVERDRATVSCGPPLPGYRVRTDGDQPGRLVISGPSVADGHLASAGPEPVDDLTLVSPDVGVVHAGEVYVFGRADDVIVIAGRNIYPQDVESSAAGVPGVRSGCVAAIPVDGGYAVLAEPSGGASGASVDLARSIKAAVLGEVGIAPIRTAVVETGTLPKTSSGKLQRKLAARQLEDGRLVVCADA